ncbi:MAG: hypothetical protein K6G12_04995 [Lachnospiraceae bacterium]|nr:hypothetical protein [Lachnospiraceae bacterium]
MGFGNETVMKGISVKKVLLILGITLSVLLSLSACAIKSDKKLSEEKLNEIRANYENYLKETYPDETFTVEVWQEYGEDIGAAGLPDYEGYLLRQVITDSKGIRFRIYSTTSIKGLKLYTRYSDDYREALEGRVHYNEIGQTVLYNDDGSVLAEFY